MQKETELNSYEIIERMKKIYNVHSDKELAVAIGITPPNINKWRNKNSVSFDVILKTSRHFNVSIDWLLLGDDTKNKLSTQEKMALIAFNDLDERGKVDAIAYMSGIKNKVASISQTVQGSSNNVVGNGNIHIVGKE